MRLQSGCMIYLLAPLHAPGDERRGEGEDDRRREVTHQTNLPTGQALRNNPTTPLENSIHRACHYRGSPAGQPGPTPRPDLLACRTPPKLTLLSIKLTFLSWLRAPLPVRYALRMCGASCRRCVCAQLTRLCCVARNAKPPREVRHCRCVLYREGCLNNPIYTVYIAPPCVARVRITPAMLGG